MIQHNTSGKRAYLIPGVIVVGVLLVALSSIVFILAVLFRPYSPPERFCTLEDVVYQAIIEKAPTWVEDFRSRGQQVDVEIPFETSNGGSYLVSADLWDIWNNKPPRLFVVMDSGWNERLGSVGYIYSPDGETSFDKYRVEPLASNVYCYWRENEFK